MSGAKRRHQHCDQRKQDKAQQRSQDLLIHKCQLLAGKYHSNRFVSVILQCLVIADVFRPINIDMISIIILSFSENHIRHFLLRAGACRRNTVLILNRGKDTGPSPEYSSINARLFLDLIQHRGVSDVHIALQQNPVLVLIITPHGKIQAIDHHRGRGSKLVPDALTVKMIKQQHSDAQHKYSQDHGR